MKLLGVNASTTAGVCRTVDKLDIFNDGSCNALYRLDGNANDESGNYHGTETAITYGGGVYERGAVFNGTSSYITSNIGSFTDFTFSYWYKPTNTTNTACIISKANDVSGDNSSQVQAGGLVLRQWLTATLSYDFTLSSAIINMTWNHIIIMREGSALKAYFNGVYINSISSVSTNPFTPNQLGRNGANALYTNGSIDQVRIFNRAITATEVATLYAECAPTSTVDNINPFEDGSLKALYQFNGDATDKTGVYNGTATNVTYGTGKFGQAVVFGGTNSRIAVSSALLTTNATFSVFAKFGNINTARIIYTDTTNAGGYAGYLKLYLSTTNTAILMRGNNASSETILLNISVPQVVVNSFNLFTTTIQGTLVILYIDGKEIGRASLAGTVGAEFYVGNGGTGFASAQAGATYDQLRIFNKALTPMEVASLYNETTPLEEPMHSLVDPFKDGSGNALYRLDGNALDESGNYNGTATSVTYGAGQFGRCAVFNGTTSQIVVPTISPTMKSISFWASRDVVEATYCAIYGGADESWFGFGSTSTAMRVSINAGTGINLNLLSAISANTIYHFVLVWESSTSLKLYRDGILQTTASVSAYQTTALTYIGRRGTALWHKGKLDQLRIFNRALTAIEVQTLYTEI